MQGRSAKKPAERTPASKAPDRKKCSLWNASRRHCLLKQEGAGEGTKEKKNVKKISFGKGQANEVERRQDPGDARCSLASTTFEVT